MCEVALLLHCSTCSVEGRRLDVKRVSNMEHRQGSCYHVGHKRVHYEIDEVQGYVFMLLTIWQRTTCSTRFSCASSTFSRHVLL